MLEVGEPVEGIEGTRKATDDRVAPVRGKSEGGEFGLPRKGRLTVREGKMREDGRSEAESGRVGSEEGNGGRPAVLLV